MNKKNFIALALSTAILAPVAAFAQIPSDASRAAQSTASPARIDERFQTPDVPTNLSPSVEVKDLVAQNAPQNAENLKFQLQSVQIENATVYSQAQLESVYADRVSTTISLADVYVIARQLTNKYRNDGYILTQVIVPPQTIDGGIVKLRVVEGYINSIIVEGNDQESALALVRSYASRIKTNSALNVKELERNLLLINDLPGVRARSVISPSTSAVGAADLRIIVERDPYDALIQLDNFGSRYLGPVQISGAASANSYFGNNERITAQLVAAPDGGLPKEMVYGSVSYEQPINKYGTKVRGSFSHTDTEPGYDLDQFNVEGRSQLMSFQVSHPIIRSRSQNLYGRLTFDWREVESTNDLETKRKDSIRSLRAGGTFQFLDTWLSAAINSIDFEISKGLDILGASDEGDANITRPFGDPQYIKANIEAQRLQRIMPDVNLLVQVSGQWSNDALLSSEEFGVGGVNIGRAYDPSEIVGDQGVSGKAELQWDNPTPVSFIPNYQVFTFFDAGRVWNEDATTNDLERESLTSTGVGIRMNFDQAIDAGAAVAIPLNRDVQTQGDQNPRFYFNLSKKF